MKKKGSNTTLKKILFCWLVKSSPPKEDEVIVYSKVYENTSDTWIWQKKKFAIPFSGTLRIYIHAFI